jgi:hypothetical protein
MLLLWMTLQGVEVQMKLVMVLEGGEVIEARSWMEKWKAWTLRGSTTRRCGAKVVKFVLYLNHHILDRFLSQESMFSYTNAGVVAIHSNMDWQVLFQPGRFAIITTSLKA